jgi:hypothetical protein
MKAKYINPSWRANWKLEIARNMKLKGFLYSNILELTGLSKEEIDKL